MAPDYVKKLDALTDHVWKLAIFRADKARISRRKLFQSYRKSFGFGARISLSLDSKGWRRDKMHESVASLSSLSPQCRLKPALDIIFVIVKHDSLDNRN